MTSLTLTKEHRNDLARAVVAARREAEAGAHEALSALAVDNHEPFACLPSDQRALRNALRAHGRQLGDARDPKRGTQSIDRLAHEMAFEHWHRMLFARFLAENNLLIHPEHRVAVSIQDCIDLAKEQSEDPWALTASFAQGMLPQIFRKDDPVLSIALPTNRRANIEKLLTDLPSDIFTATDALGWTYQFWQSEKKDEVNAAGNKIGADEVPAVTQLFTEDYMVDFLLDNTLGAWHAGKILAANPTLAESAQSEDELRKVVSLSGSPWKYLRFIKGQGGNWTPAAGTFEGWPKKAQELKCLDPCMGSGHFVVAMFERLVALRMAEQGPDETAMVAAVIRDNLFGLEIDPRCTQIGAFNLALAAWRRIGHCKLPPMNLACSGLAPHAKQDDWLKQAGRNLQLKRGMERLYALFRDAPVLGSLIDPRAGGGDLVDAEFHEVEPLLGKALDKENKDDTAHEIVVTASGVAKAANILADQFTLVATNVPYLGRGKQNEVLQRYADEFYLAARADLATCFVERCVKFCEAGGSTALVTPQNWLYLGTYKNLRRRLLSEYEWNTLVRLGTGAFETVSGEVVNVILLVLTDGRPLAKHTCATIDASDASSAVDKARALVEVAAASVSQQAQLNNPDSRVVLGIEIQGNLLSKYVSSIEGLSTGDSDRFVIKFWELPRKVTEWECLIQNVTECRLFGARTDLIRWESGNGALHASPTAHNFPAELMNGRKILGKSGIRITQMGNLPCTIYTGEIFGKSGATIVPHDSTHLPAIWLFCSSADYVRTVKSIDPTFKVTNATFAKVPFDLELWQKVAAKEYPNGLPKAFSSDPTQWLFNGQPKGSDRPLLVAVARLLGYQWPRQTGSSFPDCPALEPDGFEKYADADGIVPINPMLGEPAAEERVAALLRDAFGETRTAFDQSAVLKLIAGTGSKAASLTDWLLTDFFDQHCKLFHHRPFVWHIWDGRRDGFNALVNYHRLAGPGDGGRQLLEKLTYAYLKDWIDRQQAGVREGAAGAEARLVAAITLQKELKQILDGEPPYDIFVRWKPLSEQPIGWTPDINDGVRMNIRPFLLAKDVGKKGAGILRVKPNIKWTKDRGNEPASLRQKTDYPWFWGCDLESNPTHVTDFVGGAKFTGERWNDLHYALAAKRAARAAKGTQKK